MSGLRIAVPLRGDTTAQLHTYELTVEAREMAPGHRREAWRVRRCPGGTILAYLWLDVESGLELASCLVSRVTEFHELTIYQRPRPRSK